MAPRRNAGFLWACLETAGAVLQSAGALAEAHAEVDVPSSADDFVFKSVALRGMCGAERRTGATTVCSGPSPLDLASVSADVSSPAVAILPEAAIAPRHKAQITSRPNTSATIGHRLFLLSPSYHRCAASTLHPSDAAKAILSRDGREQRKEPGCGPGSPSPESEIMKTIRPRALKLGRNRLYVRISRERAIFRCDAGCS